MLIFSEDVFFTGEILNKIPFADNGIKRFVMQKQMIFCAKANSKHYVRCFQWALSFRTWVHKIRFIKPRHNDHCLPLYNDFHQFSDLKMHKRKKHSINSVRILSVARTGTRQMFKVNYQKWYKPCTNIFPSKLSWSFNQLQLVTLKTIGFYLSDIFLRREIVFVVHCMFYCVGN